MWIEILNFVLKRNSNGQKKVRASEVLLSRDPDVTISLNYKDIIGKISQFWDPGKFTDSVFQEKLPF